MKRRGVLGLVVGAALTAPALAQEKIADTMDQVREQARTNKKKFIADNIQLTESEAKAFWPLYDRYQRDLGALDVRLTNLIRDYGKNVKTMSDDVADRLTADAVHVEVDRAKLMEKYLPMFKNVLTGKKVARYYQLETKIHALFSFDLAKEIPLISDR